MVLDVFQMGISLECYGQIHSHLGVSPTPDSSLKA